MSIHRSHMYRGDGQRVPAIYYFILLLSVSLLFIIIDNIIFSPCIDPLQLYKTNASHNNQNVKVQEFMAEDHGQGHIRDTTENDLQFEAEKVKVNQTIVSE